MTKEKNIEYMKTYEEALEREIKDIDKKEISLAMKKVKDKDDLKDVKAIIKDLENDK